MWNNYRRCSDSVKEGNKYLHHFCPEKNSPDACRMDCAYDARKRVTLLEIVLFLLLNEIHLVFPFPEIVPTFASDPHGIFKSPDSSQTGLAISRAYRFTSSQQQ